MASKLQPAQPENGERGSLLLASAFTVGYYFSLLLYLVRSQQHHRGLQISPNFRLSCCVLFIQHKNRCISGFQFYLNTGKKTNNKSKNEMEIGVHCSERSCKRLDFLPFACEQCQKLYWCVIPGKEDLHIPHPSLFLSLSLSKDHRLPDQHACQPVQPPPPSPHDNPEVCVHTSTALRTQPIVSCLPPIYAD